MRAIFAFAFVCFIAGCGDEPQPDFEANYPCDTTLQPGVDDDRPDILVIGDSISIGYTPHMQAMLPGYDISHNRCNAMSSHSGARHIDEWLDQRPTWDAITFNHGLWDAATWINSYDYQYEANLRAVAIKIKARTANPLFILTTEVPVGTPYRENSRVIELNNIAIAVMAELSIPVLDLYTVSTWAEHAGPGDVHYSSAGSLVLATEIVDELSNLGVN